MKPDAILAWPTNCDFPMYRLELRAMRDRLGEVVVVFSPHHGRYDYREWVVQELDGLGVTWLEQPAGEWRDASVNAALDASSTEWVWFTEQDFRVYDPAFWEVVAAHEDCRDVIGFRQDERWHPACLLVRRSYVEQTRRYFGPDPVDHFYAFGEELYAAGARFLDLDEWVPGGYVHMAGLSRNHQLLDEEWYSEVYKKPEFASYLRECLSYAPSLEPGWKEQAGRWLSWYAEHGEEWA